MSPGTLLTIINTQSVVIILLSIKLIYICAEQIKKEYTNCAKEVWDIYKKTEDDHQSTIKKE